ncbi:hypothetical protein V8G54_010596 [Vigna mungo]|uniref:ORMDL family protein n=1 Tax=Vigna mungo TaxID=3915 RepID=A0AAQ3S6K9_VIGMU
MLQSREFLFSLLPLDLELHVTYHFFHWKKGTPFAEDQGIYNRLTWWEQVDNGKQLTRNRKFLTVVPLVLFDVIRILEETVLSIEEKSTAQVDLNGLPEDLVLDITQWFCSIQWLTLLSGELSNLYLIASHTTDYQNPMLFFNTVAVIVLVVAKFPHMHKVRIFGINADK